MSVLMFFIFEIIKDELQNSDKLPKNRHLYSPNDFQGEAVLKQKLVKTTCVKGGPEVIFVSHFIIILTQESPPHKTHLKRY